MTVFVLCGGWDYEGQEVLGVYSSLEEAQVAGRAISGYDFAEVAEVQLGAPVDPLRSLAVWFEHLRG